MSKFKFVVRELCFGDCGLDVDCNFLDAPLCTCGCGNYMNLVLEGNQEVADFMYSMLEECDCNYCAIFALMRDNTLIFGSKFDDGTKVVHIQDKNKGLNIDLVRELQDEFGFHCYGLLEQMEDETSFRIVME